MFAGSWLGWDLGSKMGGIMTTYTVSVIGSLIGIGLAIKLCRDYMP